MGGTTAHLHKRPVDHGLCREQRRWHDGRQRFDLAWKDRPFNNRPPRATRGRRRLAVTSVASRFPLPLHLLEVAFGVDLRVPDPMAQGARSKAFGTQQLVGLGSAYPMTVLAPVLQVRSLLDLFSRLRVLREGPLMLLAMSAEDLHLLVIVGPDITKCSVVVPTFATSDVHNAADSDLALETAVARNHRAIVHVEPDRPPGHPRLLPLSARGAFIADSLEGLDRD
mmetsp:Transcript_68775/g.199536  ORF Transcript_68775/g.199536 Transcript_68775/m.199536 type:complete len:225 (-) Transcript_68775:290-964(-)